MLCAEPPTLLSEDFTVSPCEKGGHFDLLATLTFGFGAVFFCGRLVPRVFFGDQPGLTGFSTPKTSHSREGAHGRIVYFLLILEWLHG